MSQTHPESFLFPVFGTQNGGLVRRSGDWYEFVTKPNVPGLDVGDVMPPNWGVVCANQLARDEDDFNQGLGDFFDLIFDMEREEQISLEEIRDFIPEDVVTRNTQ